MGNNITKRSKSSTSFRKRDNSSFKSSNKNTSSNIKSSITSSILQTKTNPIQQDLKIYKDIGEGMNGKVYLCENKFDKTKYALKKLIDCKQSRREIELQWRSSRNCEHIVKITDVYENKIENKKYLFVVMEYMEGGELFDRLKKKKKFTEYEVAKIMKQICMAVLHLHTMGIAHRDLKPENLLLSSKDDNAIIKLSDFGFAKEAHKGLTTPNFTPYYVPPEILAFEKYDISCDIWSLGVIMYILCCGYPPFYSIHGQAISPGMKKKIKQGQFDFPPSDWLEVSQEAKNLISAMLETIPERRINIHQIMESKWIMNFSNAPKKRLKSIKIMNNQKENWKEYIKNMGKALEEMRVNEEKKMYVKNIENVDNPLLKKRLEKNKKKLEEQQEQQEQQQHQEQQEQYVDKKSNDYDKPKIKRTQSMPISQTTLTALYYSSNLKNLNNLTNDPFSKSYK